MTKATIQQELNVIIERLQVLQEPATIGKIANSITPEMHPKTLQRRLKMLVEKGLVLANGEKKSRTYHLQNADSVQTDNASYNVKNIKATERIAHPFFSNASLEKLGYLETPPYGRVKCSYLGTLVEHYVPNESCYVPDTIRQELFELGKRFDKSLAAGTYAKQVGQRLLIDLSFNSSRLEGNTYSWLDTQKLIEQGLSVDGKINEEAVMIMNHKETIEFLLENAEKLTFSAFTIRSIHYFLSQDIISNPNACGNEREIEVSIAKSTYLPLANPYQIKEFLLLILLKAEQITDPFEQSFFVLMHLTYLQAFEDVNKRTARLACNIPFIRHNLCPLSFTDVPRDDYLKTLMLFYETHEIQPALELFVWAYKKSCEQYDVVKTSLGDIDAYRILTRAARKDAMGQIIRGGIIGPAISEFLREYCQVNNINNADKFMVMTTQDLQRLHGGAIIGLHVTEEIYIAWKNQQ